MGDSVSNIIKGTTRGEKKSTRGLGSVLTGGVSETNVAGKAKEKRESDKKQSQNIIDKSQSTSKSIIDQANSAEANSLAEAQAKANKRRTSQTKTLLKPLDAAPGTVKRKSLLGSA